MVKNNKRETPSLCQKNIQYLTYLNSLSNKNRKKFISLTSTRAQINSILEVFINFLNNNISCKRKLIYSLRKHKNYFSKLIKKSNSIKLKKKLLNTKTGGFLLQSILAVALPLLTRLFSK